MQDKNGMRCALVVAFMALASGCTQHRVPGLYDDEKARIVRMDDFDMLLMKAGVEVEDFPAGDTVSAEQANKLIQLLRFKIADGNIPAYGPRILASFLLEDGLRTGQELSRKALAARLSLYTHLAVLNPEGHLVRAYTGTALRCVGPLRIQSGVPGAGGYRVDTFYVPDGDTFREEPSLVAPAIFTPPPPPPPAPQQVANGPR